MSEKKKSGYKGVTDARLRANKKYLATQDSILVRVPKNDKAIYRDAAAAACMSLNAYVVQALNEKIERDRAAVEE